MAADTNKDMELLNALVDGELVPSERAALAARIAAEPELAHAHATLARLKAGVGEYADSIVPPAIEMRGTRSRWRAAVLAGAAAAIVAVAIFAYPDVPVHRRHQTASTVPLNALAASAKPIVPDLSAAGLVLLRVDSDGARPFEQVTAIYTGPRGCRLELRVRAAGTPAPAVAGATRTHRWSDGELVYDLAAFGMPLVRFAMIAEAAERKTRLAAAPEQAERRLREARHAAPPCTG